MHAVELIVEFIRENVAAANWSLFFNELSAVPWIQAVYERNRPKLHELRPLNEAFIDECAPKVMPEMVHLLEPTRHRELDERENLSPPDHVFYYRKTVKTQ